MLQRLSDENNRTSMIFIIFVAAVKWYHLRVEDVWFCRVTAVACICLKQPSLLKGDGTQTYSSLTLIDNLFYSLLGFFECTKTIIIASSLPFYPIKQRGQYSILNNSFLDILRRTIGKLTFTLMYSSKAVACSRMFSLDKMSNAVRCLP